MKEFSDNASPGAWLADAIPALAEILPPSLHWWRKMVEPMYRRQEVIWMKYWSILKTQMDMGKAPDCFVKQFIETGYEKLLSLIHI